jgi:thiol-disulfide isomerase/thioredoxin
MRARTVPALFLLVLGAACSLRAADPPAALASPAAATESHEAKNAEPVLVGTVTREQVEEAMPDWVQAEVEAAPDPAAVEALAAAPAGAEVTVYLGTWCGDSKRELARFWRAVDQAGGAVPFRVAYVGVDRDKKEPADLLAGIGLEYVPTFVVRRDGREVGRIVEESPHGVERDLLALVDGSAQGLVTAKQELLQQP